MKKTLKFEELSKEHQSEIKKAGKKLFVSGLLTGANYGGLLFMSNLIIVFANGAFLNSKFLELAACVIVDIYLLKQMGKANRANASEFATSVKKVLDEQ